MAAEPLKTHPPQECLPQDPFLLLPPLEWLVPVCGGGGGEILQQQTGGHFLRKATGHPHVPPCPFCVCQATGHLCFLSPPRLGLDTDEEDWRQCPRTQRRLLPGGATIPGWGAEHLQQEHQWASTGDLGTEWGTLNGDRWPLGLHA